RAIPGHRGAVHEVAFTVDGKWLVSGGADATLRVWSGTSGGLATTINTTSLVYSTAVSPNGALVAAGRFDGMVRLYDTRTGVLRATLLSLPPAADRSDWLALTPGGYLTGNDELLALMRWSMGGKPLPSETVLKVLKQPTAVAKSLAGQTLPTPTFSR